MSSYARSSALVVRMLGMQMTGIDWHWALHTRGSLVRSVSLASYELAGAYDDK